MKYSVYFGHNHYLDTLKTVLKPCDLIDLIVPGEMSQFYAQPVDDARLWLSNYVFLSFIVYESLIFRNQNNSLEHLKHVPSKCPQKLKSFKRIDLFWGNRKSCRPIISGKLICFNGHYSSYRCPMTITNKKPILILVIVGTMQSGGFVMHSEPIRACRMHQLSRLNWSLLIKIWTSFTDR